MAQAVKKKLEDALEKVAAVRLGDANSEDGRSALRLLQTAVRNASSGTYGSPDDFLGDLEPKTHVLAFILEIHEKNKRFRKITEVTLQMLLEQRSWAAALKADPDLYSSLPDEVREIIEEELEGAVAPPPAPAVVPPADEPAPPPSGARPSAGLAVPKAAGGSGATLAPPVSSTTTTASMEPTCPVVHVPSPGAGKGPSTAASPSPPARKVSIAASPSPPAPKAPTTGATGGAEETTSSASHTAPPRGGAGKVPTQTAVGRAIAAAWRDIDAEKKAAAASAAKGVSDKAALSAGDEAVTADHPAMQLLRKGLAMMEELDYCANNTDGASSAFEVFRRGTTMLSRVSTGEEVNKVEPKDSILEFLVDLYERRRILRSRVSSLLVLLLEYEEWSAAADADPATRALVGGISAPVPASRPPVQTLAALRTGDGTVNLRKAAAQAAKRGAIGVLLVRVRAAYNLVPSDASASVDPYARVMFGRRMKRTVAKEATCDPRWDAEPFLFEVSPEDQVVKFEVLDNELAEDHMMGTLELSVSDAATTAGMPPVRRRLDGVDQGELEVELVYAAADGAPAAFDPPKRAPVSAPAPACAGACPLPIAAAEPVKPPVTAPAVPVAVAPHAPARPVGRAETWVAWLSIVPQSGDLQFYPGTVCELLENSYQRQDKGIDLGETFYGARVFFQPRMVQRTKRGSRDIRRVEMEQPEGKASVLVAKGSDWRSADDGAHGAEMREAIAPPGAAIRVQKEEVAEKPKSGWGWFG